MGSKGDPWDIASAESCISTIKNELVKRRTFVTRDPARLALFRYIESFYNPLRRHSSLAMRSPDEYEHRYWEDNAGAKNRYEAISCISANPRERELRCVHKRPRGVGVVRTDPPSPANSS
ncbi:MAG: transposase [Actinobacteria bacterium]|nr:transposase [Actinomycetota bacterium]